MSKLLLFLLILYIIFSSCAVAVHYRVSDLDSATPESTPSNKDNPIEGIAGGNFESPDSLPAINRDIKPNYIDYSLINKMNHINVTIQGIGRIIDDIIIREEIDENLEFDKELRAYIEDPIFHNRRIIYKRNESGLDVSKQNESNTLEDRIKTMSENYTVINNTIYIKLKRLKPGENLVYSYDVSSKKTGSFMLETLLRINNSKWPDLLSKEKIEVRPPVFEVRPISYDSSAIRGKDFDIVYNILHRSGLCNNVIEVLLFFNESKDYDITINNLKYDNTYIKLNITQLEIAQYPIKVKYKNYGTHPVPLLGIVGATVEQESSDIDVKPDKITKFLIDYSSVITLFIALIGFILTGFEILRIEIEIKKMQ